MAKYDEIMEHIEVSDEMNSRVLKNIESHFEKEASKHTHMTDPADVPVARHKGSNRSTLKWMTSIGVAAAVLILCVYPLSMMIISFYRPQYNVDYNYPSENNQNEGEQKTSEDNKEKDKDEDVNNVTVQNNQKPPENDNYSDEYAENKSEYPSEDYEADGSDQYSEDENTVGFESAFYEVRTLQELSEAVGFNVPEVEGIPFYVTDVSYFVVDSSAEIDYSGKAGEFLRFDMSRGTDTGYRYLSRDEFEKNVNILSTDVILTGNEEGIFGASWADGEFVYSLHISEGIDEISMVHMVESVIRNKT